jgi:hypothetical protein
MCCEIRDEPFAHLSPFLILPFEVLVQGRGVSAVSLAYQRKARGGSIDV